MKGRLRLMKKGLHMRRAMLGLFLPAMAAVAFAETRYVDATRPDDAGDGLSWTTAKHTIQAAINASSPGDTISVTNGTYAPISTTNQAIIIQSVNGVEATTIDGGNTSRCATLGEYGGHTNTILVGFTLRDGRSDFGGGVYRGTLRDCVLTSNTASGDGAGLIAAR